jgi:hypothetical protein
VKKIEDDDSDFRELSKHGSWFCLPVKQAAMVDGRAHVKRYLVKVRGIPNVTTGSFKEIV